MSKKTLKPVTLAVGTAFAATLAMSNVAMADTNPFGMSDLSSGYMVAGKEGQCGGAKTEKEGQCGGAKATSEGKCGEGKCGGDKGKEGKCGGNK